jgi:hypothetical protein
MPVIDKWFTLATAGETADERMIEEQWLRDMAETYNADYYAAVIDADHELDWYGSYGHVTELRLGEKLGRLSLEGKLDVNQRLMEMNKNGQRLWFSIWPRENFSDTGKTYLFRLAVTDSPSSIGTDRMKFSAKGKTQKFSAPITEPQPLELNTETQEDQPLTQSSFTKLFYDVFNSLKPQTPTPPNDEQEADDMTKEQFEAMMNAQKEQAETQLAAINGLGEKFTAAIEAKPAAAPAAAKAEGEEENETPEQKQFNELKTKFDELNGKFTDMLKEKPGTTQGDHDGNQGDDEDQVI